MTVERKVLRKNLYSKPNTNQTTNRTNNIRAETDVLLTTLVVNYLLTTPTPYSTNHGPTHSDLDDYPVASKALMSKIHNRLTSDDQVSGAAVRSMLVGNTAGKLSTVSFVGIQKLQE